jgi:DNA-binding response OmpR family regulator
MMPNVDGFDFVQSVRRTDKTTPIIFMTAKDDKPSKMLGYRLGVDDYVTKPFDMDVLLLKIGAMLRRSKIELDNELAVGNFFMNREDAIAYY